MEDKAVHTPSNLHSRSILIESHFLKILCSDNSVGGSVKYVVAPVFS